MGRKTPAPSAVHPSPSGASRHLPMNGEDNSGAAPPAPAAPPPHKWGGATSGGDWFSYSFVRQDLAVFQADLSPRLAGDVGVVGDQHDRHALLAVQAFQQVDQLLR